MPSASRRRRLRAGPLEATWEDAALRWISIDGVEVLRGILLTARDADWRTIAPRVSHLRVETGPDQFSIAFDAAFRGGSLDVNARVSYRGDDTGSLSATFAGSVETESVVQRLGLIVLHPSSVAGRPIEIVHDVGQDRGAFPVLVTPERFATEVRALRWMPEDGLEASLEFDGEPWETEDQRAWSDASFKSYSPPLSRAHPVTLAARATVEAGLRLEVAQTGGSRSAPARRSQLRPTSGRPEQVVVVGTGVLGPIPPVGLAWPGPIAREDLEQLRLLHPGHLRVIVDRQDVRWRETLQSAAHDGLSAATPLQLELVGFDDDRGRDALLGALSQMSTPIVDALAFGTASDDGLLTTDGSGVAALRDGLRARLPGMSMGGGTRAGFAELAGGTVPVGSLDSVAFTVSPQVHATDIDTIIENLGTLHVLVRSATALAAGHPLDVLASFRPRLDVYASPPGRGLSSARFDDRLPDGPGAVWFVGTLAGLLAPAVRRLTVLEGSGRAGILASPALRTMFGAISSAIGSEMIRVEASPGVTALAIRSDTLTVMVANLRECSTVVELVPPTGLRSRDARSRLPLEPFGIQRIELSPR